MIVYVETNFILEVALRQEEHEACEHVMTAAEAATARLVIPAFSLVEGWSTLRRRREERQRLLPALRTQADTLSRSAGAPNVFAQLLTEWSLLEPALRQSEEDGMRAACSRVVGCAEVVDLTSADVTRALELAERLGLRFEDALVLAAVLQHASSAPSGSAVFLNRNKRDFGAPEVLRELSARVVKGLASFSGGLALVRGNVAP